jgi:hypothetical protein
MDDRGIGVGFPAEKLYICSLHLRFPNWWVASRFVVGRKKFLKCDFFNYMKIKNHKKWESEKQNKIRKG